MQKILSNTGWLFADRILRLGVGLFVSLWVARYLGPEQFGIYNYALAFVALFGPLATLGLDGIVVRDIVNDPSQKDEILGAAFRLKLIGGFLSLLLTVSVISLIRPGDNLILWLVGITAAGTIFQAFDTVDLWFQSQVHSKFTVYAKNIAFIILSIVKVGLILLGASLIAFAWAGLAETVLGIIGLVIAYRLNGNYFKAWRGSLTVARNLLKDSWPSILSGMTIMVYMKIDQIMLGNMLGNNAVGIYSAALRVSEFWYFIPGAIVSSVFPSIVRAKQQSLDLYYSRISTLYSILIWSSLSVAILLTFLSTSIMTHLFGEKYGSAGVVLSIHIWTGVFVFYGVGKGVFIQIENMRFFSFICTASGALLNVILNVILIKRYGIIGAALATLSAHIMSALIIPSFYARDRINVKLFFKSIFGFKYERI